MIDRHEALEHHVHQTMMKSSMNPIEQKIFHEKRNENMFRHRSYCRKVGCARLHADFVHGEFVEDECEERMRDEMIQNAVAIRFQHEFSGRLFRVVFKFESL